MATIADAIRRGALLEYVMPDHELEAPKRRLLASPDFFEWLDGTPALHASKVGGRTLYEHAEIMLCDLRCAAKPAPGEIRRMIPDRAGVWTARPPKLRLYGWWARGPEFVVISGALEADTKADRNLNNRKRDEVIDFARSNGLEATMLKGDVRAIFPS